MKRFLTGCTLLFFTIFGIATNVNAHTVSLSWRVLNNGDVLFYDQHWHGSLSSPDGSLFIDGVEYPFDGFINSLTSINNLDGALVNATYAMFAGGTLTTLSEPNFLTVTVSGLQPGPHTFGTTNIALTQWTMPSNGGQIQVVLPPPPPNPQVNAPATFGLLMASGAALLLYRRKTQAPKLQVST
ncbi:hypothetical protein OCL06_13150 [Alteromonas sp. ASW11-19]|uniref:PEP-CTERM protein-sorting domain-containing protein n=1 Tax=Alteromonas salexigens TaxID=2982530 RepID=A0ABT2VQF7_9ALTE|nr:hypothetical protein [Alteromonas salexigens]MCU7555537.1 hypothetical protein [Alteromonas salexigens]